MAGTSNVVAFRKSKDPDGPKLTMNTRLFSASVRR
ncbi:hypothetical protein [Actinomadura formosensis]